MKRKICIILIILIILVCVILCIINRKPVITLIGDEIVFLELNSNYQELGYSARYIHKDITEKVEINTNLDNTKVGTYKVEYIVKINKKKYSKIRQINVIDSTSPVINLLGSGTIEICPNEKYTEIGYSAYDKVDGDITNEVQTYIDNDSVSYYVENSIGNKVLTERKIVRDDNDNPSIKLNGYQSTTLYIGDTYFEPGYNAIDNCDGDITNQVEISGHVDTNKVGKYKLLYTVKDSFGNITSIDRIINVLEKNDKNQKTIYLTFDDGPSFTTTKILDILKEENVKATFFIINAQEKYDSVIKRAYDEGHTIGLHSYSHKYKAIYKSIDAYFDDLELINDKVKKITGYPSNIIRFPGGSSNTISKISRGLMTKLSVETKERGYLYYDWNIASSDTSNISSKKVYKNVISNLKYNTNIVLMHDFANNNKTVKALKNIIEYGKKNGYKFDKITELTPQIKHEIRN